MISAVYVIYGNDVCGNLSSSIEEVYQTVTNIIPQTGDIPTGENCEWGEGATFNLMACVLYFASGLLLCCSPQPKPLCQQK